MHYIIYALSVHLYKALLFHHSLCCHISKALLGNESQSTDALRNAAASASFEKQKMAVSNAKLYNKTYPDQITSDFLSFFVKLDTLNDISIHIQKLTKLESTCQIWNLLLAMVNIYPTVLKMWFKLF